MPGMATYTQKPLHWIQILQVLQETPGLSPIGKRQQILPSLQTHRSLSGADSTGFAVADHDRNARKQQQEQGGESAHCQCGGLAGASLPAELGCHDDNTHTHTHK